MDKIMSDRASFIRKALNLHVERRLSLALDKLEGKEDAISKKDREKAIEFFKLDSILEEGCRFCSQVQIATHIVKATHPDIKVKEATNILVGDEVSLTRQEVGTGSVSPSNRRIDATGNGAVNKKVYEAYLLLSTAYGERSVLDLIKEGDLDAISALSMNTEKANELADTLISIDSDRCEFAASHSLTKQIYWLAGDDVTDNANYHLLAPLYSTSLAHAVYEVVHADRFGEANKLARQARRERKQHNGVFRDYPNLAVQNLGGTKPQNISQLNSERRGNNYLLSSLPPKWQQRNMRMPWHVSSVIDRYFLNREYVRDTVNQFRQFLEKEPGSTMATRNRVDGYIASLIDLMVRMAGDFSQGMEPGWTKDVRCELALCEQLWLDPLRADSDEEFCTQWLRMDWPEQVGARFGVWLNQQLEGKLVLGDVEYRHWKKELLVDEGPDSWAQQLHHMRNKLSGISVEDIAG